MHTVQLKHELYRINETFRLIHAHLTHFFVLTFISMKVNFHFPDNHDGRTILRRNHLLEDQLDLYLFTVVLYSPMQYVYNSV